MPYFINGNLGLGPSRHLPHHLELSLLFLLRHSLVLHPLRIPQPKLNEAGNRLYQIKHQCALYLFALFRPHTLPYLQDPKF